MRIWLIIIWGIIGLCLFCTGCRVAITATDFEASAEIYQKGEVRTPIYKYNYDQNNIGIGTVKERQ